MSTRSDESRSLLPSSSSFPQQGQVDWGVLSKNTVNFTLETLSRISKAGIEALTIYAAGALFRHARLASHGEMRVLDALKRAGAFSSKNETLWFGFGIKSIVRSLSESQHGLACMGICACLAEQFSVQTSAKILKELFLLYHPPEELVPSLQQWHCLVDSCSGVLASSDFGTLLSGIARICLLDGQSKLQKSAAPEAIAKVLKGLFDVSSGSIQRVRIAGGADCAWFAAAAHWLFGLSVTIEDEAGTPLYRPGTTTSVVFQDSQVIIQYSTKKSMTKTENSAVIQKCYVIPSGQTLMRGCRIDGDSILTHGRVDWSTCLCDVFGKPMEALMTTFAPQTGACLGSAARIYEHIMCDMKQTLLPSEVYHEWHLKPSRSSFGRGFYVHACRTFSELQKVPELMITFERMLDKSPDAAIREFIESINSIRTCCKCIICNDWPRTSDSSRSKQYLQGDNRYCSVFLITVLLDLIRLSSQVNFQKDLSIRPTFAGIEQIYGEQDFRGLRQSEHDINLLIPNSSRSMSFLIDRIRLLFTGRQMFGHSTYDFDNYSANAAEGICIYFKSLCEVSDNPEYVCSLDVVPGKIEWNGRMYGKVLDNDSRFDNDAVDLQWENDSESTITRYDNLSDSSSDDLDVALIVEETTATSVNSIVAKWQISSPKGFFYIGPQLIATKMGEAYSAKTCAMADCGSLDGFKTVHMKGVGVRKQERLEGVSRSYPLGSDPIVRVLTGNPAAVWVALAREESRAVCLQSQQCIKCTVMIAIQRASRSTIRLRESRRPVCVLTSVKVTGEE